MVTPALERIVEANTLLSGLGFESSGLAAAHAIHNGLTAVSETHPYLHGEKVAFGVLTQLVLEGAPGDETASVLAFCTRVGLPVTLAELGLADAKCGTIEQIAARATAEGETIHNEPFAVDPEMVTDAIIAADALGKAHHTALPTAWASWSRRPLPDPTDIPCHSRDPSGQHRSRPCEQTQRRLLLSPCPASTTGLDQLLTGRSSLVTVAPDDWPLGHFRRSRQDLSL